MSFLVNLSKKMLLLFLFALCPRGKFLPFFSGTSIGISLSQNHSPFAVVTICNILLLLSVLSVSFVENLVGYIMIYMVIFGITSGMIYLIPIRIAWVYFPKRKGELAKEHL